MLCSFLLGLGDSCFNTQLFSIIGLVFHNNSAPAFAVFRLIQVSLGCRKPPDSLICPIKCWYLLFLSSQSIMAAVAFFYSNFLLLHWQLLILVVTGFLGSVTFFLAEWTVQSRRRESDYDSI